MTLADNTDSAFHTIRRIAFVGVAIAALFFFGLGGWAAVAPIDSAALAPGVVSVEFQRKTIQHLEGGIVASILVKDGDRVSVGQPLLELDKTQSRATLGQLSTRYYAALALEARLIAERDGLDEIIFPEPLLSRKTDSDVAESMHGEANIFAARRDSMRGQAEILEQRIAQYQQEIQGLEGQIRAERKQLALIAEERSAEEKLVAKKLTGMQRVIELKRDEAEIEGSRSRNIANIARARQSIAEEQLKILELSTQQASEVVAELRNTQTLLFDVSERMRAARDVLQRTQVRSPLDGIVVDNQVHTVGGVISPGETLMDIVPSAERLIVEARVSPQDIDSVHVGLGAQIALTAFNRRNIPPLGGHVMFVSADRLTEERTGLAYFLARIALPEEPAGAYADLELYPGMQAEVMIVTGERTAIDYMFRPVIQSFGRALREQ